MKETARPSEAEAAYLKARVLQEELASAFPRVPAYRKGLAATENNLGLLWQSTGNTADAKRTLLRALELQQSLVAAFPNVPDYRSRVALTRLNLGTMLERTDPQRAEALLRAARTENEDLVAAFPGVPEYGFALGNALYCLGDLRAQGNDLAEARRLLEKAIQRLRVAFESDPRSPSYRLSLCLCYRDYAEVLKRQAAHAELADAGSGIAPPRPRRPRLFSLCRDLPRRLQALAAADTKLAQTEPVVQQYARTAVGLLRKAFEQRLIVDPKELANDNFEPIRQRDDFQKLLEEMKRSIRRPLSSPDRPGKIPTIRPIHPIHIRKCPTRLFRAA